MRKLRHFIKEKNGGDIIVLTFPNVIAYNKSESILINNNFKKHQYKTNDTFKTIEFNSNLKDVILHLLKDIHFKVEHKKLLK